MNYIDKTKADLIRIIESLERKVSRLEQERPDRKRSGSRSEDDLLGDEGRILRTLIDRVPDFVYAKDRESRFVLSNEAHAQDTGARDQKSLLGKTDFDFFPRDLAQGYFNDEQELLRTGKSLVNQEEQHSGPGGKALWMSTTKIPMRNDQGDIVGLVGISRDITERKEYERALVFERQLLHALTGSVPDSIYFKDSRSRFVRANTTWAAWAGVKDPARAVGKTDFDFFPKEEASAMFADEQEIVRTGKALVGKVERISPPGQPQRWVSITKVPIYDEQGGVIGTCGISRDITKLIETEERLAHERDLLNALMDSVPYSIYFKDSESRFLRVNKAWANRRRLTDPEEVVGKTDFDFFPPAVAQRYYEEEQRIVKSGRPLIGKAEKVEVPDMPTRWNSVTKVPIVHKNGKIIGTCGISHDITSLKEVESELARERDLLHTLMEYSTDFIYFKDRQSRFTRLNRAHAVRLGFENPEDAVGKTDFDVHTLEHAQEAYADEQQIIRSGKPLIGKVEHESLPSSPDSWVLTSKAPVYDTAHRTIGTFGISRDITELKRAEKALQEAYDDLERRVAERTTDLRQANVRLEQRIEQLDFLTSATYGLAQFIDIQELLPAILDVFVVRFSKAEASICLREETGFVCAAATKGLDNKGGREASEKALEVFLRTELRRPYVVDRWPREEHVSQFAWPGVDTLPFYMAFPLLADNRVIAIVQIFADTVAEDHYKEEEQVLTTLATQASISLSNALHYRELGEKARLQGELDAARNIQLGLTPQHKPAIPRMDLKGLYCPAHEVGGDYLDYFETENGDWVAVVADVCGNGIPAALVTTVLRNTFRLQARKEQSAKRLLCAVNDSIWYGLDEHSFVTALCLIISADGGRMSCARAGHPKLIKIGAGGKVETVEAEGVALGLVTNSEHYGRIMDEVQIELQPGERYLLYTDGLSEAWNEHKACYGVERLAAVLGGELGETPESMLEAILDDVKTFTKGAPYHDDLTMLAMKVGGAA